MCALLDVAGLDGAPDAVRLAVLVLASRTPSSTGRVEIRTAELGRWLGLSASYVASVVLPGLRRSGVVEIVTVSGEFGEDRGLECRVLPLWGARGQLGHPLALRKKEYATLLRLLEALFAPGWAHRDGTVTPAGLLGGRTGRGAATDRLALLLLVLEARESGRVRLCGGTVEIKRGRAAATVARLLGCTASGGERVLARLESAGLVERVRRETASGLAHRSRLVVPAVAAAHRTSTVSPVREDRAGAGAGHITEPDGTAGGSDSPRTAAEGQVNDGAGTGEAGVAEPDAAAGLHAGHSPVVDVVGDGAGGSWFSGEAPSECCDRPECACAREDQALGASAGAQLRLVAGEGDPLRGERQTNSTPGQDLGGLQATGTSRDQPGRPSPTELPVGSRQAPNSQQQKLVSRSIHGIENTFEVTGPAAPRPDREGACRRFGWFARHVPMTAGLLADVVGEPNRHQRRLLDRMLGGLLAEGEDDTMIAARLRKRLAPLATGDSARPYRFRRDGLSWALSIGLPYTPGGRTLVPCSVGGCANRVRGKVTALRLRCDECELAPLETDPETVAAAQRMKRVGRGQTAVEEREYLAQPCADCGVEGTAGLCGDCEEYRKTERLVAQSVQLVAAVYADGPAERAALAHRTEAEVRARIQAAVDEHRHLDTDAEWALALVARLEAESAAAAYRREALTMLARTATADAEARAAADACLGDHHLSLTAARVAADQARAEARENAAHELLTRRLTAVRNAVEPGEPVNGLVDDACPGHGRQPCGRVRTDGGLCRLCRMRSGPARRASAGGRTVPGARGASDDEYLDDAGRGRGSFPLPQQTAALVPPAARPDPYAAGPTRVRAALGWAPGAREQRTARGRR